MAARTASRRSPCGAKVESAANSACDREYQFPVKWVRFFVRRTYIVEMSNTSNRYRAILSGVFGGIMFLGACGTISPEGQSTAYREGYFIGCTEGYEISGRYGDMVVMRDEQRYVADAEYRRGWDDGYRTCFDEGIAKPVGEGSATI